MSLGIHFQDVQRCKGHMLLRNLHSARPFTQFQRRYRCSERKKVLVRANKTWKGFNWFGLGQDSSKPAEGKEEAEVSLDAEDGQSWETAEPEWEGETDTTKANPLGLFIMLLIFLGSIFLTTTVFRAAGNWRKSRKQKRMPSSSVAAEKENLGDQTHADSDQDRHSEQSSSDPQSEKEALVDSEPSQKDKEIAKDLNSFHEEKQREAKPRNPATQNAVYTPQAGWVDISETDLSEVDDGEQQKAQQPVEKEDEQSRANEESNEDEQGHEERSENSNNHNSQLPHGIPTSENLERSQEGLKSSDERQAAQVQEESSSDNGNQSQEIESSDRRPQAPQQPNEAQQRLQQAAQELEDRMESSGSEFWGESRPPTANGKIDDLVMPKVTEFELPRVSEEELQQYSSRGLNSLRSRAGVASRASLAASEASQRAVAYSAAASQAASKATWHAQRALAASHIAQQAAVTESERVLSQAVERAESAAAQAEAAEHEAAEAAAHASAHEEVSASQSQASKKAAELPEQEERETDAAPESDSKMASSRRSVRKLWSRIKQKVIGLIYVLQHWSQGLGHRLMEWLTVSLAWVKKLFGNAERTLHNAWLSAKGLVHKK